MCDRKTALIVGIRDSCFHNSYMSHSIIVALADVTFQPENARKNAPPIDPRISTTHRQDASVRCATRRAKNGKSSFDHHQKLGFQI